MGVPGMMVAAGGAAWRGAGRGGAGMLGTTPGPVCAGAGGETRASGEAPGKGWRGPESI
jgi:hypothetical protein